MYATSFFIHIHDSHFAFSSIGITPTPKHKNTWNHVHIKLGSCGHSMYGNASFIHIHDFHFAFSSIGIPPPPQEHKTHETMFALNWILVVIACFIHIHVFSFANSFLGFLVSRKTQKHETMFTLNWWLFIMVGNSLHVHEEIDYNSTFTIPSSSCQIFIYLFIIFSLLHLQLEFLKNLALSKTWPYIYIYIHTCNKWNNHAQ